MPFQAGSILTNASSLKKDRTGFFLFVFLFGLFDTLRGVLLPELRAFYGINYKLASLIYSATGFGYLLGNLFSGYFYKKFRFDELVKLLFIPLILSLTVSFIIRNYFIFLACMALYGFFVSAIFTVTTMIVCDLASDEEKASHVNLLHFFYAFGAFFAPLYAHAVTAIIPSYRYVFLFPALIAFNLILYFKYLGIGDVPHRESPLQDGVKGIGTLAVVLFFAVTVFYIGTEIGISGWMKNYVLEKAQLGEWTSNIFLTVFFVSLMLGRLITSFIVKHIRAKLSYVLALTISGLAVFSAGLYLDIYILMPVSALFYGGVLPTIVGEFKRSTPGRDELLGILMASGSFGSMLFIFLIGAVNDGSGLKSGMSVNILIGAITALIAASLVIIAGKNGRRMPEPGAPKRPHIQ